MDIYARMDKIARPYFICGGTVEGGPLYDYGVCGILEDFLQQLMEDGEASCAWSYCDFACDGCCVQGCMTITIFQQHFVPEVITFLYEKELERGR